MTHADIHQELTAVFQDVFDDSGIVLTDATTAKDVPDWDSIMHVNLIVAVEKAFGTTFTTKEVKALANVGDFIALIARHTP